MKSTVFFPPYPLTLAPLLAWARLIIARLAPSPVVMFVLALCLLPALTAQGQTANRQVIAGWGLNSLGELGDNSSENRTLPVDLAASSALNGKTIIQIVAGGVHSFALCSDGTLVGWGFDYYGQLGTGHTNGQIVRFPVNLTNSGALRGKTVVQVAAGDYHSMALCSDGTIAAWGFNEFGQLGDGTTTHKSLPTDITGSGALSGKRVNLIVAGSYHNLALCSDGSAVAWGHNGGGQLGDGTRIQRNLPITITSQGVLNGRKVTKLLAGTFHSAALCSDGTLAFWGDNTFGQVGDDATQARLEPVSINGNGALRGKTLSQLWVGYFQNAILCTDGSVVVWGDNREGALGDGTNTNRSLPIFITGNGALAGKTVTQIALGSDHSVALCSDGTLASWGANQYGSVGDGTLVDRNLPVAITSHGTLKGRTVTQLAAGGHHTLALTEDATPPSNQAPTATIVTPTFGQSLALSAFNGDTLTGTASDDNAVTKVEIKLYRRRGGVNQFWNGRAFTTTSTAVLATRSGSGPSITWKMGLQAPAQSLLDAGEYEIIVNARDAESLKGVAWSKFTLTPPVSPADTISPVPTIIHPGANQEMPITSFTSGFVAGSATDNVGVTRVNLRLVRNRGGVNQFWNGTSFTTTSAAVPATISGSATNVSWVMGGKTPPQNQLDAGVYVLTAYAIDAAGNVGGTQKTFTLQASLKDTEKPVPFISTPTPSQTIPITNLTASSIKGGATDNVGVSRVDLQLYRIRNGVIQFWNGTSFVTTTTSVPVTLSGSGTSVSWSLGAKTPPQNLLDAGVYHLIASATDAAGNVGVSEVRSFTIGPKSPFLAGNTSPRGARVVGLG